MSPVATKTSSSPSKAVADVSVTVSTSKATASSTDAPERTDLAPVSELTKEEDLLKEYSKELYVYTLDLLNSVRIDNAHKGVGGKTYALKRTISDIAVPLKTASISESSKPAKAAV